ncbi:alpha/beta hydrolase [Nocardia sp. NPDC050697]|uniref:alpha/beta fold hydrolase n=1 Tax=Nocardia sp. NPDC050697 TaxID=3155158 RepID=UPI0033F4D567
MTTSIAHVADRRVTVAADDGTPLAARVIGADSAEVTLVFVHGHCLRADTWSFLGERLAREWGGSARLVSYDHRGHGHSGAGAAASYTIDQLAHDLDAVLRALAPTGPIVLVGHSMGAMTALAHARLFPQSVGTRIAGLALIATAASGLTDVGLGRLLNRRAIGALQRAVLRAPRFMGASHRLSRRLLEPIMGEANLGTAPVSPRVRALAIAMFNETPLLTMTSFLEPLRTFDESEGLHRLAGIPALVLAGSADLVTPFAHSVVLASQLPAAELVRVDGAGHGVIIERVDEVAEALSGLVRRVLAGARVYAMAG